MRDTGHMVATFGAGFDAPDTKGSSGCMNTAATAPAAINPIVPMKGSGQSPVLSITRPNTNGDKIAASAEPQFINPLAVPD